MVADETKPRKASRSRKRHRPAGVRPDGRPIGAKRPVDMHVGARLRLRRSLLGMSQGALGDAVGLTFQQIQKYENGANRVSASRLWELSRVLEVPISYFFDDMPEDVEAEESERVAGFGDKYEGPSDLNPLARRETMELLRAYYKIGDSQARQRVFNLIKSLARAKWPPEE